MLGLHTMPPLDACTYVGLDNGAQPLSVSEHLRPSLSLYKDSEVQLLPFLSPSLLHLYATFFQQL